MIDSSRRTPSGSLDGALSRSLLEQIGAGALLYAFALPALCFILWPVVPTQYLIPWAIILALTAIARTAIARLEQQERRSKQPMFLGCAAARALC